MLELGQAVYDLIYPVGSIYLSVNSVNPSTLFGGTWARWGNGRVPVGVDTSQTEFNTVGKTGGSKTHTLTINEMPNHSHTFGRTNTGSQPDGYALMGGYTSTGEVTPNAVGGGLAHNNLQPYITCYMWKRTA